ncbi:hypothetical protein D0Z07_8091 [Hyphodiscus hymeniophilus]|uniref:ARCA protein n=1 Tax=Hyphodiscus hymeniophilus TaxID=353542 RepID=A0A9P7AU00_9HELO|nr:hypothetical protein D0Z07_8091 [Hyphodiscus hymeniophilus]
MLTDLPVQFQNFDSTAELQLEDVQLLGSPGVDEGDSEIDTNRQAYSPTIAPENKFPADDSRANDYSFDRTGPLWPLRSRDEAFLLQYFSTDLALWFDYCVKDNPFATIVIPAAATSPTLLNAILAVSARHLSVTQGFDRYAADKYQHECLKTLIPALENPEALLDDKLFAATVILRFFNEMTEPIDEPSPSQHVIGSHLLIEARERACAQVSESCGTSSLRSATFNIELRQEIHIAFMTNRPLPTCLVNYGDIDRTLEPTDDWMWTYRIIAHTADTLNYCNGSGPKTPSHWEELWQYLETWEKALPSSFNPIFEEEADPSTGRIFPDIWLANDCHAAGHHYVAMCRILLLAHDPSIPLLGPDRTAALKAMDQQIKELTLKICGVACSNRQHVPIMFTAGVSIAMCKLRLSLSSTGLADSRFQAESDSQKGKSRKHFYGLWITRKRISFGRV